VERFEVKEDKFSIVGSEFIDLSSIKCGEMWVSTRNTLPCFKFLTSKVASLLANNHVIIVGGWFFKTSWSKDGIFAVLVLVFTVGFHQWVLTCKISGRWALESDFEIWTWFASVSAGITLDSVLGASVLQVKAVCLVLRVDLVCLDISALHGDWGGAKAGGRNLSAAHSVLQFSLLVFLDDVGERFILVRFVLIKVEPVGPFGVWEVLVSLSTDEVHLGIAMDKLWSVLSEVHGQTTFSQWSILDDISLKWESGVTSEGINCLRDWSFQASCGSCDEWKRLEWSEHWKFWEENWWPDSETWVDTTDWLVGKFNWTFGWVLEDLAITNEERFSFEKVVSLLILVEGEWFLDAGQFSSNALTLQRSINVVLEGAGFNKKTFSSNVLEWELAFWFVTNCECSFTTSVHSESCSFMFVSLLAVDPAFGSLLLFLEDHAVNLVSILDVVRKSSVQFHVVADALGHS